MSGLQAARGAFDLAMATPPSIKEVLMGSGKGEMNLAAVRSWPLFLGLS